MPVPASNKKMSIKNAANYDRTEKIIRLLIFTCKSITQFEFNEIVFSNNI